MLDHKILFISTNKRFQAYADRLLSYPDLDVAFMDSLYEAFQYLQTSIPKLLITDIFSEKMPLMEFLMLKKINPLAKQVPVVVLCSSTNPSIRHALLEEGASYVINTSDVDSNDFCRQILELVEDKPLKINHETPVYIYLEPKSQPTEINTLLSPIIEKEKFDKNVGSLISTIKFLNIGAKLSGRGFSSQTDIEYAQRLVSSDSFLSEALKKFANSSYYEQTNSRIETVSEAIERIGLTNLADVVTTFEIINNLIEISKKDVYIQKVILHSITTGLIARKIAYLTNYALKDQCFLAGLLHDIGVIIGLSFFEKEWKKIVEVISQTRLPISYLEQRMIGTDHGEIGYKIAQKLELSTAIAYAINYHHIDYLDIKNKRVDYNDLVTIIRLADALCNLTGATIFDNEDIEFLPKELFEQIGLDRTRISEEVSMVWPVAQELFSLFFPECSRDYVQSLNVMENFVDRIDCQSITVEIFSENYFYNYIETILKILGCDYQKIIHNTLTGKFYKDATVRIININSSFEVKQFIRHSLKDVSYGTKSLLIIDEEVYKSFQQKLSVFEDLVILPKPHSLKEFLDSFEKILRPCEETETSISFLQKDYHH